MTNARQLDGETSRWPLWTMLLFGHLGADASRDSQRADRRSRIAIGIFVVLAVVVALSPGLEPGGRRHATAMLVAATLGYLGWQRWRYADALDELTRRLYLEAFAITYLVALALIPVLGLLEHLIGWTASPLTFLALEPVRAIVLAWRSRRFA